MVHMPYVIIPALELKQLGDSSPLPLHLQQAQIYDYDTSEFPFRACVAQVLGVTVEELEYIHNTPGGKACLAKGAAAGRLKRRKDYFVKKWNSSRNCQPPSRARQRFNEILDRFMETFVAPRMAAIEGGEVAEVAYQRDAIMRVVMPEGPNTTNLHCDADYHHPPAEVNWWFPFTPVSGSNSLFVESRPGAGDFKPVQLQYGQVLRFYGNLCQHYSVPNTTPTSRVSCDVRVLSLPHHSYDWKDRLGRTCIHKVGQYYVKPGQIQTAVAEEEEEEEGVEKPLKGSLEGSDDEEGLEEESKKTVTKKPGQIHTSEEGVEEPLAGSEEREKSF